MSRIIILIPTFLEATHIESLLLELAKQAPTADILVIDDNSSDGTQNRVRDIMSANPRVHLLPRPSRQGLASAYLDGIAWALARDYQSIIQMDADFSHRPSDLAFLLDTLKSADAVFGCRYALGGSTPGWNLWRRFLSRCGNFYARLVLGLPYRDLTGGFNAWRRDVLEAILRHPIHSRGYAFQIELKYMAHCLGFSMREVAITFEERRAGRSKISSNILWEAIMRIPYLRCKRISK